MNTSSIRYCVEPGDLPAAPRPLRDFFRRLVCRHAWERVSEERYDAIDRVGRKAFEIDVLTLRCSRFREIKLIPISRRESR